MTPDDKFPSSPLILPCYAHPIFPNKTFISLWFAHVFQWRFPMAARCLLLRGRHGLRFSTLLPASVHRRWLLEIFKGWVRSSSRRPKTGEIPWDIFDIHGMQLKYVNKSISWLVSLNMECLLNEPFCSKHDEASIVGGAPGPTSSAQMAMALAQNPGKQMLSQWPVLKCGSRMILQWLDPISII
jgi:hypothetical protein